MWFGRLVLLLIPATLAPAPVVHAQEPSARFPTVEERELGQEALELLNAAREADGQPPLQGSEALDLLAYQHSSEMAERGVVTHFSYLHGVNTRSRFRLAFPNVFQYAENVARNRDVAALHRALMDSRGHRLNRMDGSFTHAGIGVARAGPHQLYITEVFARPAAGAELEIDVLYTVADPADLPADSPAHGQVMSETVRIGRPGDDDPEYWTRNGIDAFDAGEFATAVEHFEHALRLQPDYGYARFNLARSLLRAGRPARALGVLEEHLATAPDDLDAWWTRGTAALATERYETAEASFRRVLSGRPRDASGWYNLGLSLEYQSRLAEADSAYAQALHLDPELHAARDALARIRG